MRKWIVAGALAAFCVGAQAATCEEQATGKRLAGAARASFVKKCTADAGAACEKQAADRKLHGAARTSFVKKCSAG